jgi:methylated-DNA-[protein]-cysteine S-methyltransferase
MPYIAFATPFGDLTLFEESGKIVASEWGRAVMGMHAKHDGGRATKLLDRARKQLDDYFDGKRRRFTLPTAPEGTPYQLRVWEAITRIPYGETRSYGDIAHETDSGPRAVGTACRECPIGILIPCHRVIGAGGRIGGWSSITGLDGKRALLRLEGAL